MSSANEYEIEPIPGVPGILPASETILWQGRPAWQSFLVHALYLKWVAGYFAVLTAWRFSAALSDGMTPGAAVTSALWLMPMWLAVIAMMAGYAWGISRSTIYTLTSKRLIMRSGVAVPIAVNVPYSQVSGAGLKVFADGTGQVALELDGEIRLAYLAIWPNARPGHYLNPQPLIRCIPEPAKVASILAKALADSQTAALPVSVAQPVRAGQREGSRALQPMTTVAA
jgi:Bacterial PH domain